MKYFALILLVACTYAQQQLPCDDLSCASREDLLQMVLDLKEEKNELRTSQNEYLQASFWKGNAAQDATDGNCNICSSNPCNSGQCIVDPKNPWTRYFCLCPDNFGGNNCEIPIVCKENSCGVGASCYVSNHQINCICPYGSTGNPKKSCNFKTVESCVNGDPHYTTFDGLYYDYQGTCPYDYTYPCNSSGFYDFRVVAKNHQIYSDVSVPSEVEVTFYGQKIHVDGIKKRLFINGVLSNVPFYWPAKNAIRYSVKHSGGNYIISSNQKITVTFTYGKLCVSVPQALSGNDTLCGAAGNFDKNYKNDIRYRNGTVFKIVSRHMPTPETSLEMNRAIDTWITDDFLMLKDVDPVCVKGETIRNNSNCDNEKAQKKCMAIQEAATGGGPLGACINMTSDVILNWFDNCVFDVCHEYPKCDYLTTFVRTCQNMFPNVNLNNWRTSESISCALQCPPNSHYSDCSSSCPATCADQDAPEFCDYPCTEGCTCDQGYVLDNTQLGIVTCIPVEKCGCTDPSGNFHPPNQPWIIGNCSAVAECDKGIYKSQVNRCSQYATCTLSWDGHVGCVCNHGFKGDGITCEDINECLDPTTCGANTGNGICTNTIGSYNCTCNVYFGGNDCENYSPRRHCADYYKYIGARTSGVYKIYPPTADGLPSAVGVNVYCDMEITENGAQGGWTLMSHSDSNLMENKTYKQYQDGFGDSSVANVWLGLDWINRITTFTPTSLYVKLHYCAENNMKAQDKYCHYQSFKVDDSSSNYTVTIPFTCQGSAADYKDGWARWKLSEPGPQFTTYDRDSSLKHCSNSFQNTGFWFDTTVRCGSADLNGVRFSCDNIPDDSDESTYLYWNGSPVGDAWLYIRPTNYPAYDQHAITLE